MGRAEDEEEDAVKEKDEEEAANASDAWTPDFHWLTDNIAVGGCFPADCAGELSSEHQIGAVVDLREEDCDDERALRDHGVRFLYLPTPDLEPPNVQTLDEGVRFVRDRLRDGDKVLIHCHHGIGRSALLALCVLVDQGWSPLHALAHAKDRREVISPSRAQYQGWAEWLVSRGKTAPDYHTFGCIAYRHLANG